ncbi:Short repeat of unknown function (DUF308) [Parafrankia irregularis]|uniref:DUF308 domain-containing protein n=1 Tax=Parafrankia irregularis TaxID=795642 RepID=A0A0S4QLI7_9ACTN|nr:MULTISPECIES: DUF308 domain-containing protein [Parafrankia]MBE3202140.1 DUF308 domain-containing protein [Parafrankia sp. CH37]CUU55922.1 Short repeat of unknown function (DUF308) [Parafrankia irregularis]
MSASGDRGHDLRGHGHDLHGHAFHEHGRGRGHGGASGGAGAGQDLGAKAMGALLPLGIGWLLFALAIPMFGLTTGKSIAVLLGITLLLGALSELVTGLASGVSWRPTHAALAVALAAGGIVALVWPSPTLAVVARIAAWSLLALGIHALVSAFSQRQAAHGGTWWAPLTIGAFSVAMAFWAATHHHPTYSLVVLWVALTALVIGLTKFAATMRSADGEEPRLDTLMHSGFSGRAAAGAARAEQQPHMDPAAPTRGGGGS